MLVCFNGVVIFLQVSKKQRYRFSLIMNEMKFAELLTYKATLLALINCIVVGAEELEDRVRLRNEFIGEDTSWLSRF
jgi:hypothetical protein